MYRITLTPTLTSGWKRQGAEDIRVYCVDQWSVVPSTMELVYIMQKHRNFGVMHDDVPQMAVHLLPERWQQKAGMDVVCTSKENKKFRRRDRQGMESEKNTN